MAGKKINKVAFLFPREELDNILTDIISLEIIEVSEPTLPQDDIDLESKIKKETIDIVKHNANQETLTFLGTETTLYLTGWIWAKSEQALKNMIARHICAWSIESPTPEELDEAPIILKRPGFLYGMYKGHRDLFYPLGLKEESDE